MQPAGIATFGPGTGQTGVPTLLHLVELVALSKEHVMVPTKF